MIDRAARDKAAQALRNFISGKITNFDFESLCPETDDPAVHAICETAWLFYDDFKTHRLTGTNGLGIDQRKACVRWILFLHSDQAYRWPLLSLPGCDPNLRVRKSLWRSVLGLDRSDLSFEKAKTFLAAGHYAVWPFISVQDYKQALRSPRLLSGQRAA